jgi:hypothetical protein
LYKERNLLLSKPERYATKDAESLNKSFVILRETSGTLKEKKENYI